ncbi:MAG: hypothetical protein VB142_12620 [Burkholderia sp.]
MISIALTRAMLVDKDHAPRWRFASPAELTRKAVKAMFESP